MTGQLRLPADVVKEIRALLPAWLISVAIVSLGGIHDDSGFLLRAGVLAYFIGCGALGGLAIGHEYLNRTLTLLLSTPTSRRRAFAVKAGVVVPMLLILGAAAATTIIAPPASTQRLEDTAVMSTLAFLGALFVAPWMTMVCRNALAGGLFGISIPCMVLAGSQLLALTVYGTAGIHTPAADRLSSAVLWWGVTLVCALGALMTWRSFMRLEIIDGRDEHVRLPIWVPEPSAEAISTVTPHRRHAIYALVIKELHLQQLTFMATGLYLCGWVTVLLLHRFADGVGDQPLVIVTAIHGVIVAFLSGSLASAEERHFGMLQSQVLMPMSTARQWLVKAGFVLSLTVTLGVALPAALALLTPWGEPMRINWPFAGVVVFLSAISLYVSSLCTSGVRALLFSLPASLFAIFGLQACAWIAGLLVRAVTKVSPRDVWLMIGFGPVQMAVFGGILILLLLRFGLVNHRAGDRGARHLWRQILWMAASMAVVMIVSDLLNVR